MTKVDLNSLTNEEKLALVAEIGKTMPLGPVELPGTPLSFIPVNYDAVPPDSLINVPVICHQVFKIHRLVILEQTTGEEEVTAVKSPRLGDPSNVISAKPPEVVPAKLARCPDCGSPPDQRHKSFCRKQWEQVKVSVEERTKQIIAERARGLRPDPPMPPSTRVVHVMPRLIPRTAWEVAGFFIGNHMVWSGIGVLNGDAFGPYGTMDVDAPACQVGMSITLQVKHNLRVWAVPFRAVLLGRTADRASLSPAPKLRKCQLAFGPIEGRAGETHKVAAGPLSCAFRAEKFVGNSFKKDDRGEWVQADHVAYHKGLVVGRTVAPTESFHLEVTFNEDGMWLGTAFGISPAKSPPAEVPLGATCPECGNHGGNPHMAFCPRRGA